MSAEAVDSKADEDDAAERENSEPADAAAFGKHTLEKRTPVMVATIATERSVGIKPTVESVTVSEGLEDAAPAIPPTLEP